MTQVEVNLIICFVTVFLRYDLPHYGSRRRLISPMYDEYGEVIMEDDGYYYSPHGPEVFHVLKALILT